MFEEIIENRMKQMLDTQSRMITLNMTMIGISLSAMLTANEIAFGTATKTLDLFKLNLSKMKIITEE